MFLILMVIGLVGLATMAIPAFAGHGAATMTHGHPGAFHHGAGGGDLPGHAPGHAGALGAPHGHSTAAADAQSSQEMLPATVASRTRIVRWLPSPRAVFTAFALFG